MVLLVVFGINLLYAHRGALVLFRGFSSFWNFLFLVQWEPLNT